ncbi:MAG: ElyC/SanA/YdcF family protein [Thermoanaerobaculia bacterium]
MSTVAIVCGYDLHSELSEYVRRLVPILVAARPDTIVLSGGRTSRHIDDSEANAMSVALAGHLSHPNVILEESAMTTLDNIVFARSIARSNDVSRYLVICDRVHAAKVTLLSALLLRRNFRVHTVPRKMPLRIALFEPVSLVAEALAAVFPIFRSTLRRSAMFLKGITGPSPRSAPQGVA